MKPEISIVVPVYNVESYIKRCLDSISAQSMREIEVLLIDDGSTDKSGEICDSYAKSDKRFSVIHQENKGLSGARNIGLKYATGKYIMFVDPDDYVENDFCKIPYEVAEKNNTDLVMFCWKNICNGVIKDFIKEGFSDGFVSKQEAIDLMFEVTTPSVWNNLFKKELIGDVLFPEGHIFEDNDFTYKMILNSKSIFFINLPLYVNCSRDNSLSKRQDREAKTDLILMHYNMVHELKKLGYTFQIYPGVLSAALRYQACFGNFGPYSAQCNELIQLFDNNRNLKFRARFFLYIYKHFRLLFDFIGFVIFKRNTSKYF